MATEYLVRRPDCPTCRQPVYDLVACRCSHPRLSHDERGRCTVTQGPNGLRCLCKQFTDGGEAS
jgi:hypothetical protein